MVRLEYQQVAVLNLTTFAIQPLISGLICVQKHEHLQRTARLFPCRANRQHSTSPVLYKHGQDRPEYLREGDLRKRMRSIPSTIQALNLGRMYEHPETVFCYVPEPFSTSRASHQCPSTHC